MRISEAQSRAIAHGEGPAMVLAGPGSGKTLVITNRTKYLIEHYHVEHQSLNNYNNIQKFLYHLH